MSLKDADGMANSVDPDTDLGLHCLPRIITVLHRFFCNILFSLEFNLIFNSVLNCLH